jgi:hypothetical protein
MSKKLNPELAQLTRANKIQERIIAKYSKLVAVLSRGK